MVQVCLVKKSYKKKQWRDNLLCYKGTTDVSPKDGRWLILDANTFLLFLLLAFFYFIIIFLVHQVKRFLTFCVC